MAFLILNKEQADQVRGRWGIYSVIEPVLCPDGTYIVPEDCLSDSDLASIKNILQSMATNLVEIPMLPLQGQQCVAGQLYNYASENNKSDLVKCVQTHNRTEHPVETIPALFSFFRENSDALEWIENEYVEVGWKRMYNGVQYEVIQKHQTLSNWTPTNTIGVLWKSLAPPTAEWKIGVAYKVNDIVTYKSKTYKCLQAHTSINGWFPDVVPAIWRVQ